jgi:hypothetical protein
MMVYLVPVGRGRFELYSETADHAPAHTEGSGFWARQATRVRETWREWVRLARNPQANAGWISALRDELVRRAAETMAEQRTLWALRQAVEATLVYPVGIEQPRPTLVGSLDRARRFHFRWMCLDAIALAAAGLLALVPGPNIVAYYFALRLIGHVLCWRGARRGIESITWSWQPDCALAELELLVDVPRAARAARVEAIGEELKLRRLAAFFDRAALPAR